MYEFISVSSADWQYIFIEGKQTDGQKQQQNTIACGLLALSLYDT